MQDQLARCLFEYLKSTDRRFRYITYEQAERSQSLFIEQVNDSKVDLIVCDDIRGWTLRGDYFEQYIVQSVAVDLYIHYSGLSYADLVSRNYSPSFSDQLMFLLRQVGLSGTLVLESASLLGTNKLCLASTASAALLLLQSLRQQTPEYRYSTLTQYKFIKLVFYMAAQNYVEDAKLYVLVVKLRLAVENYHDAVQDPNAAQGSGFDGAIARYVLENWEALQALLQECMETSTRAPDEFSQLQLDALLGALLYDQGMFRNFIQSAGLATEAMDFTLRFAEQLYAGKIKPTEELLQQYNMSMVWLGVENVFAKLGALAASSRRSAELLHTNQLVVAIFRQNSRFCTALVSQVLSELASDLGKNPTLADCAAAYQQLITFQCYLDDTLFPAAEFPVFDGGNSAPGCAGSLDATCEWLRGCVECVHDNIGLHTIAQVQAMLFEFSCTLVQHTAAAAQAVSDIDVMDNAVIELKNVLQSTVESTEKLRLTDPVRERLGGAVSEALLPSYTRIFFRRAERRLCDNMQYEGVSQRPQGDGAPTERSSLADEVSFYLHSYAIDRLPVSAANARAAFETAVQVAARLFGSALPDAQPGCPELCSVFDGGSTRKSFLQLFGPERYQYNPTSGYSSAELAACCQSARGAERARRVLDALFGATLADTPLEPLAGPPPWPPLCVKDVYRLVQLTRLRICALSELHRELGAFYMRLASQRDLLGDLAAELRAAIDGLVARYTAFCSAYTFYGLRGVIQQVFTPAVAACGLRTLQEKLCEILAHLAGGAPPQWASDIFVRFFDDLGVVMATVLLDSGQRARTLLPEDMPSVRQQIDELAEGMLAVVHETLGQGPPELLERLRHAFFKVMQLVGLHEVETAQLLQMAENILPERFAEMDCHKPLEQIHGDEQCVRVLNFRRYSDEAAHKFMHRAKRTAR